MSASAPTIPCRHVQPNGHACGSPALRREQFCYYHHPTRRPPRPRGRKPQLPNFQLPPLDNRPHIQRALAKIVSRVLSGRLDRNTARLLLSTLQLANRNLPGQARPLGSLIARARKSLRLPESDALADLFQFLRCPPASAQKMYEVRG